MSANTGYTIFETFVGAGGSHIGFMQENFRTVYVNDFIDDCLKTLVYNNQNLIEEANFFIFQNHFFRGLRIVVHSLLFWAVFFSAWYSLYGFIG